MRSSTVFGVLLVLLLALSYGIAADKKVNGGANAVKMESEEAVAEEAKHEFIGAAICQLCHQQGGTYESWLATKHAYAWDSLSAEGQKNQNLAMYYTTGVTADGELLTGVQCEACHGPGSDYKKMPIMKDREKAVAAGLVIPDEKTCQRCHNEEAPPALAALAEDFDFEKMKAMGIHKMRQKKVEPEEETSEKKDSKE